MVPVLIFVIGVGSAPVPCQRYRGNFLAYYTDKSIWAEAPRGDVISVSRKENHRTASPYSAVILFRIGLGVWTAEAPWGSLQ